MGIFRAIMALSWTAAGFSGNFLSLMNVEMVILMGGGAMLLSGLLMVSYSKWRFARP